MHDSQQPLLIVPLGDSMTHTQGPGCPHLAEEIRRLRPGLDFEIRNYGIGSTRAENGLWRLTSNHELDGQPMPSIAACQPDLVILESYAYNNGADGEAGLANYRAVLDQLVTAITQHIGAELLFVVTIAPDREHFVENVEGFDQMEASARAALADDRHLYLREAVRWATDRKLLLANAYQATLDAERTGTPRSTFIDPADHIHPSPAGHRLVAQVVVKALMENDLL